MSRFVLSCVVMGLLTSSAGAHYNMLLPSSPSVKKGQKVTFTHLWGHPFEHAIADAPALRQAYVITPDGKKISLIKQLAAFKVDGAEGKSVGAHRFEFTPEQRGDYTFVIVTAPTFMPDVKESVEDIVRVVLHVQSQRGWGAVTGEASELVPVTRPYGLLPGMVFQARAMFPLPPEQVKEKGTASQPLPGAIVEWERYNAKPTKEVPDDDLITFRTQTDALGGLTCSLPEPGWWGITVSRPAGNYDVQGKPHPLKQRMTLWVHVSEKK